MNWLVAIASFTGGCVVGLLVEGIRARAPWIFEESRPDSDPPPRPPLDLEHVIVERLASMGTEHGAALAFELERGRRRRGMSPDQP